MCYWQQFSFSQHKLSCIKVLGMISQIFSFLGESDCQLIHNFPIASQYLYLWERNLYFMSENGCIQGYSRDFYLKYCSGEVLLKKKSLWWLQEQMNRGNSFQLGHSIHLVNIENDWHGNELSSEMNLFRYIKHFKNLYKLLLPGLMLKWF